MVTDLECLFRRSGLDICHYKDPRTCVMIKSVPRFQSQLPSVDVKLRGTIALARPRTTIWFTFEPPYLLSRTFCAALPATYYRTYQ
ncbi:hypothetical protein NPIL_329051 [Nephila pilipes]|uniref:Uncharacterized protein n=1 Tax=Nephila pilipes TaxID=299642 RepID=A0A8X6UHR6_NEPPI|nr:hypothetical protein NPIL_329051 [Nephila pilipes]